MAENGKVTMTDLEPGTRVRHTRWNLEGTIRAGEAGRRFAHFKEAFVDPEISDMGPVWPEDLEILPQGSGPGA